MCIALYHHFHNRKTIRCFCIKLCVPYAFQNVPLETTVQTAVQCVLAMKQTRCHVHLTQAAVRVRQAGMAPTAIRTKMSVAPTQTHVLQIQNAQTRPGRTFVTAKMAMLNLEMGHAKVN